MGTHSAADVRICYVSSFNQVVTQTVDLVELKTVDMVELGGFEAEPPTDSDPHAEVALRGKGKHHDSELKSKAKTSRHVVWMRRIMQIRLRWGFICGGVAEYILNK